MEVGAGHTCLRKGLLVSVFPVLIMAVCSGCRSVPRGESGFYPIGLWGVRDTNHFEIVKAAGFNALTGPASR
ncbi:MAG: hypothetical protein N3G20_08310, partial [Verrucomicrobiae bacterium]|nr:hypothetical protein [Verrucomicrobiae bacterium]